MSAEQLSLSASAEFRGRWLEQVRLDPKVPHVGFRVAYMIAHKADHQGMISQRLIEIAGHAGVQIESLGNALERLANLRYIAFERGGRREPTVIQMQRVVSMPRKRQLVPPIVTAPA